MGRNLSPVLQRELENLDKDSESRRSAMKALNCYVKDLDSKTIPHFLAQFSKTKEPGSSFGEYTISLYEVLARVHGRNIVPQIDNIMSTVIRTLSSTTGSFPLHQACSKVVSAIARYGIDPSTPDAEKTRIICSLCKPLSNALMGSENITSGAALCLKALAECDNWRFASKEMVNDVCLKVTGAMEEKPTQTDSHMGLVMALAKHNALLVEDYSRLLLRSGLEIVMADASESTPQKRFSAIHMINFLMKCVEARTYSSELEKVIEVMDRSFQADQMPFVRGAAFEALQTAKLIYIQNGCKHGTCSSATSCSNSNVIDDRANSFPGFASPESQTVNSFFEYDNLTESPSSIAQTSSKFKYAKRSHRRLWSDGSSNVNVSLKDGLFLRACAEVDNSFGDKQLSDVTQDQSEGFSGFIQNSATDSVTPETASSSPQMRLSVDGLKLCSTPKKLIRSLQNDIDASHDDLSKAQNAIIVKTASSELRKVAAADQERQIKTSGLHSGVNGSQTSSSKMLKELLDDDADMVPDSAESVSSTDDISEVSTCKGLCKAAENKDDNQFLQRTVLINGAYNKVVAGFLCAVFFFYLQSTCML